MLKETFYIVVYTNGFETASVGPQAGFPSTDLIEATITEHVGDSAKIDKRYTLA